MSQSFDLLSDDRREYRRFNTVGTQLTMRLIPPTDPGTNPVDNFLANMKHVFEHVLQCAADSDIVAVTTSTRTIELWVYVLDGGPSYLQT
jgi:hypothetical protein